MRRLYQTGEGASVEAESTLLEGCFPAEAGVQASRYFRAPLDSGAGFYQHNTHETYKSCAQYGITRRSYAAERGKDVLTNGGAGFGGLCAKD